MPYLDLKGEILLQILDDHNKEGKLDAQCLLGVCRTCYVGGTVETRGTDKGDYMQPSSLYFRDVTPSRALMARFIVMTATTERGWRRRARFNQFT